MAHTREENDEDEGETFSKIFFIREDEGGGIANNCVYLLKKTF